MKRFWQNFWIFEKKLAKRSAYLVYNGIFNRKNLKKSKMFMLGTKTHLYELICHPHITEDQTKPVCLMKKINLIKKNLIYLRFMIFAITVELHCNGKNIKLPINLIFLDQTDFFFIKQTGLVWSPSFCGWHMSSYKQVLVSKKKILGFWRFLPIPIPL